VTNATWNDVWLNEGVTTYIQGRIVEALYGKERAAMEDSLAWAEMKRLYAGVGRDKVDTRLRLDLGDDPDDTSDIAYQKGAAFLRTLEHIVGRARFDAWLKGYFARHAFQPITSKAFLIDLRAHLVRGDRALENKLQLDAWVYGAPLPSNVWMPTSSAFARVETDARRFLGGAPASSIATARWSSQEWQHFLQAMPLALDRARLDDLEKTFKLSETGNSEVLFDWLWLAVHNRYEPALPSLEHFLTSQGRMKFVRPLYQALMDQGDWGQPIARRIYATARAGYHPLTAQAVDTVMTTKA
jgi:leukotriene-A4 hydrolase